MKKMQCEVCGSTSIKKIDETTFECQSCGVQYSKDELQKLLVEITGTVKVDHSDEVENTIKRAEQFENEGDSKKAKEYYNMALDMDADNELAQQKMEKISDSQTLEDYYIVEAKVKPEDNVKHFLKELAVAENVACDIYKEITIKNIHQKYYTFVYSKYNIECEWSAIVCNRYYENETVYKTVYRNGKEFKEPKTEKVEKIQRTPRNGVYKYQAEGLIFSSQNLNQAIDVYDVDNKNAIVEDFASLQSDKYNSYITNRVNPKEVNKEDGKYFYKGYELDLEFDNDLYKKNGKEIVDKEGLEIVPRMVKQIGGDFFESPHTNVSYRCAEKKHICIPVQVIEYEYKGTSYFAVSDLVSQTTSISKLYPSDAVLESSNEVLSNMDKKLQSTSEYTKIGVGFGLAGFGGIFLGGITEGAGLIIGGLVCFLISLILVLLGVWKKGKEEKALAKSTSEKITSVYNPRKLALSDSYNCFFATLDSNGSYTDAKNAVTDVLVVENTVVRLSKAGENKDFSLETNISLNEKETFILQKQEELNKFKKKYLIAVILTIVGIFVWPLLVVGLVMVIKTGNKIFQCNKEIQEARENMMK